MDNGAIADNLSLLAKLMDIHGDNSFKAKTYSSAAYTIDKLPVELSTLSTEKIFGIKGIGEATGKKIIEQIHTGNLQVLDEYVEKTPPGILQMLQIKGLGPKKISTIWKELEIENIGELLYACEENRLLLYKGFGEKTQQNIRESIEFYLSNQGSYLYAQVEKLAEEYNDLLKKNFKKNRFEITGNFRRHSLIIDCLEWVTDASVANLENFFLKDEYEIEKDDQLLIARGPHNLKLIFHCTEPSLIINKLFSTTASEEFFRSFRDRFSWSTSKTYKTEDEIFKENKLQFIEPYLRETGEIIDKALNSAVPEAITLADIRGIIHSHSDWSDGINTIEEMAKEAIKQGFEYLVISDHSQSASYAKGLFPDRIKAQHALIDELNDKLKPFRIFKSIESDILSDGSLDYEAGVLKSFDLVIGSIHSNFKMTKEKATARLIRAVSNPYTTILGHMTGRLLLSRNGYPVDVEAVIDACAENNVAIELNAHPRRLDIDWRWIDKALTKGVFISIDPDAHSYGAFSHVKYGVLAAQKGGLPKEANVSSFNLQQFENFLKVQQQKRS
jgi:DNA polymerase (family 10)